MFWMNLFTLLLQLKKIFFYIFGLLVGVNKHFIWKKWSYINM